MVALTYGDVRVPSAAKTANKTATKAATKAASVAPPLKPWYARLLNAMVEARMQQARREIRMYTHLMPYTIDEHGNRKLKTEMNDVPFGGW